MSPGLASDPENSDTTDDEISFSLLRDFDGVFARPSGGRLFLPETLESNQDVGRVDEVFGLCERQSNIGS